MLGGLHATEILIILLIAMLVFGPAVVKRKAGGVAKGLKGFATNIKKEIDDDDETDKPADKKEIDAK